MKRLLRSLFYRLFRSRTRLSVAGIECTFVTGTPDLYERIEKVGGERFQLERFIERLRPGDVVWDVGANVGMYTVFASRSVGESGLVCAFEPEPIACKRLRQNLKLNRLTNARVLDVALSDRDGASQLFPARRGEYAVHSLRSGGRNVARGIPVRMRSGHGLVPKDLPAPTVIKMDIEGAEHQALIGMRGLLAARTCRHLFLELHPIELEKFESTEQEVRLLIEECEFTVTQEQTRGNQHHLFCDKTHSVST